MQHDYSLLSILNILIKWSKKIIFGTIAIALIAAFLSLLLPNYYKSTTIFYAANPDVASAPGVGPDHDPLYIFGGDAELDRLFSLANSSEVINALIKKFDLYKHYGIDSSGAKAELEMDLTFKSLYKTVKTKYDAIELTVEDRDPRLAQAIALEARKLTEDMSQKWILNTYETVSESYTKNVKDLTQRANRISDSIQIIKLKHHIFDTRYQLEASAMSLTSNTRNLIESKAKVKFYQQNPNPDSLSKYRAMLAAAESLSTYYDSNLKLWNGGLSELRLLEQEYGRIIDQLSITKERKAQLDSYTDVHIKTLLIVEEAKIPKVKSRPKRLIMVVAATIVGFTLLILGALMIENLKSKNVIG